MLLVLALVCCWLVAAFCCLLFTVAAQVMKYIVLPSLLEWHYGERHSYARSYMMNKIVLYSWPVFNILGSLLPHGGLHPISKGTLSVQ